MVVLVADLALPAQVGTFSFTVSGAILVPGMLFQINSILLRSLTGTRPWAEFWDER